MKSKKIKIDKEKINHYMVNWILWFYSTDENGVLQRYPETSEYGFTNDELTMISKKKNQLRKIVTTINTQTFF